VTTQAYIDASNIIYSLKSSSWQLDFKKLKNYLKEKYQVSKIFYFGGRDTENKKQESFYKVLEKLGYELKLVNVKQFSNGKKKADIDSFMTFEVMKNFNSYNSILLFTGDGDYYHLFEFLRNQKKNTKLFSNPQTCALDLKKLFGSDFIDLLRLKSLLQK
jgi:uncharacterized LabA/DUF88 family protein